MATAEELLKSVYEYSLKTAENGKEYVVRGAKISCGYGSHSNALNLPQSHGEVSADKRPLITYSDTGKKNVGSFGVCKVLSTNEKTVSCVPMLGNWSYERNNKDIYNQVTKKNEKAVTRGAIAACNNSEVVKALAGKTNLPKEAVLIETSGQVVAEYKGKGISGAIETEENKKYSWKRDDQGMDLFAHLKITNTGIYNFGINASQSVKGTIFVYSKPFMGGLQYVGAYEFSSHGIEQREGFKDTKDIIHITTGQNATSYTEKVAFYWTIWADIMLEAYTDYYIEIDCPGIDSFDYKYIGNREQLYHISKSNVYDSIIGSVWTLDENYNRDNFPLNHQSHSNLNLGVDIFIFHLNDYARPMISSLLEKLVEADSTWFDFFKKNGGDISSILGVISLGSMSVPLLSTIASILGLIVSNLPKTFIEELCIVMKEDVMEAVKITVKDCKSIEDLGYQIQQKPLDTVSKLDYWVYGAKYLKGSFPIIMPGYTSSGLKENYLGRMIKELDEAIGMLG